jgi:thiamine pyrophosphate-dependent acetolactate synthase large subunit-like protein
MGLASSIALGVAIKNPNKRIYVFDGDGNILMNLGSITTVGALQQKNYVHIVFDNESHESTGGQPTHTRKIDLKNIAKSVNYTVYKIMTENGLQRILTKIQNIPGPIMIIIKIEENTHVSKRVSLNTIKIRDRFMNFLKK